MTTHSCTTCGLPCTLEMPFTGKCFGTVHLCAAGHSWVTVNPPRTSSHA